MRRKLSGLKIVASVYGLMVIGVAFYGIKKLKYKVKEKISE